MNDTGYVAIVDTDRDELRDRIDQARRRFYRLARSADPDARRRGLDWNVHQVIAHVLCVARRYQAVIEGRDFRRALHPRELDQINQEEMLAAMAPIPELLEDLEALEPVMDAYFDSLSDDYTVEFHCGAMASGIVAQVNWLFDLVLHGEDIARAVGVPWAISERDMLLLLREFVELAPAYLKAEVSPATDICVALRIPGARPYVMHVHNGTLEVRPRRSGDRPDAVVKAPASTMIRLILHRIGPVTAVRRGLRVVGGRRPWKAMQLQSCIERA
ncbi:maleylpyruvate isomerase N-terminal domain-containing protein [Mycolicibacterium sp. CR10]|uniref:maleylpyruvate isomerase N-terminal domain-containing protein n=1 Tax=Mycolicibacterium sp. CR10 TaxID=2562314 RepID=UPI0010C117D5|nr:maleylpyruvate isomerase N-terminal domain-containing protein [Mycolicibacterium sp. CR10]